MAKGRWEEILSTAARLFREKGYRATTMDDIAAELKVTKPAIYYYIKTKHDLLYSVCEAAVDQLIDGVRKIEKSYDPPTRKLQQLIRWQVNMFSQYGDVMSVYLADEGELEPEKRHYVRSLSREYEQVYRQVIEQAVAEGSFRQINVPVVVRAISGMCNWLSQWYKPDGPMTAEEIGDVFFGLVVEGCGATKRGTAAKAKMERPERRD